MPQYAQRRLLSKIKFDLSFPESSEMTATQFYDNLGMSNTVSFYYCAIEILKHLFNEFESDIF